METQLEFETLRREQSSWWGVVRCKLLRDAVSNSLGDKREARILDLGCTADLQFPDRPNFRVLGAHSSLPSVAFRQIEGSQNLLCTSMEELGVTSNAFDMIVAGDVLQSVPDDVVALREMRRVLKDGGSLCLTVPAYSFLWGEEDETLGHQRRYTASELRRKLNNCGFEISRVSYVVASGLLPAMVQRFGKNVFSKSVARHRGESETAPWANAVTIGIMDCERYLIRYINLPFGTRLVCWARKPTLVAERIVVPAWERQWTTRPLPQGSS